MGSKLQLKLYHDFHDPTSINCWPQQVSILKTNEQLSILEIYFPKLNTLTNQFKIKLHTNSKL